MSISIETRRSIQQEVSISPRNGHSFGMYRDVMGYKGREQMLAGKLILDVGAGDSNFSIEAKRFGATVISIDPRYNHEPKHLTKEERMIYQYGITESKNNSLAAIAQELPFRNESFDEVVPLYCIYWIKTAFSESIKEMLRITKKNGLISIYPADMKSNEAKDLPSYAYARHVNPDYGFPTALVLRKDPEIARKDLDEFIECRLRRIIAADDVQYARAEVVSRKPKPVKTRTLLANH